MTPDGLKDAVREVVQKVAAQAQEQRLRTEAVGAPEEALDDEEPPETPKVPRKADKRPPEPVWEDDEEPAAKPAEAPPAIDWDEGEPTSPAPSADTAPAVDNKSDSDGGEGEMMMGMGSPAPSSGADAGKKKAQRKKAPPKGWKPAGHTDLHLARSIEVPWLA